MFPWHSIIQDIWQTLAVGSLDIPSSKTSDKRSLSEKPEVHCGPLQSLPQVCCLPSVYEGLQITALTVFFPSSLPSGPSDSSAIGLIGHQIPRPTDSSATPRCRPWPFHDGLSSPQRQDCLRDGQAHLHDRCRFSQSWGKFQSDL